MPALLPHVELAPCFGIELLTMFENHAARFAPSYVPGKTVLRSKLTGREWRCEAVAGEQITLRLMNVRFDPMRPV